MRPDSDEHYCFHWCGRMQWACVRNTTGRDCNWVLARRLGRIVPGRVESWGGDMNRRYPWSHAIEFVTRQTQEQRQHQINSMG
jgi:hypothetical protein